MSDESRSPRSAPNRLAQETSPYLLQHAYNPVDWYPWGPEAFERAVREDKPVFLSIGYSACHWCHVMEHESFENDEIAAILNQHFISIKVDREERPDLDQIYMTAVQALTQRGGWPMSVFLTPDQQPFFGGTYWPPNSRMGMRGFREILQLIQNAWITRREDITRSADSLTQAVDQMASSLLEPQTLTVETLKNAGRALLASADRHDGGFGGAPKFPHPMDLRVLLRCHANFDMPDTLDVCQLTLDRMAGGGLYDHLGGGFHRYSTDARWLVPHFEKMLYDNALLTLAYLEAWQLTKQPAYARIIRETLEYVLREMTSPEGAYFSTQDADSEGVEGKFFVWTPAEIEAVLGPDRARAFCAAYDVTPEGNWEDHSILNRPRPLRDVAAELGLTESTLEQQLAEDRPRLLEARSKRIAPGRDEKILTSWNGLMIAAMSRAGFILNEPRYTDSARRAATFLLEKMRDNQGRLLHSCKDGVARFSACLDDYACLIDGLVELYQATSEPHWLEEAVTLADRMVQDFTDSETGGFFYTAHDHEALITRLKDSQDNATPSGNGMAATALLKLGALTGLSRFTTAGEETLSALSGLMSQHPRAAGQSLIALSFLFGPVRQIIILEDGQSEVADEMRNKLRSRFSNRDVLICHPASEPVPSILSAMLDGKTLIEGQTSLYLCEGQTCQPAIMSAAGI